MTHSRDFQPAHGRERITSAPPPDYVWPNGLDAPNDDASEHPASTIAGQKPSRDTAKKIRRRLMQTGATGGAYLLWALSDIPLLLTLEGVTFSDFLFELGLRLGLVGLPLALMLKRKGFVSSAFLTVLALLLGLSAFADGESVSGVFHLFFAAAFVRGAWVIRKLRKLKS